MPSTWRVAASRLSNRCTTSSDVTRTLEQMIAVPYNREFEVTNGIRATFVDAGHILGSASVLLDCQREWREASAGVLGRHRAMGTADHS